MKPSKWTYLMLVSATLLLNVITARGSYPVVVNYSRKTTGGGTQTWDAVQDSVGRMYFANKNGLLIYNGNEWQLEQIPHGLTIRSSFLDNASRRLYIGSSEELGYFSLNEDSYTLNYHSLRTLLGAAPRSFGEVWDIHKLGNTVWFRADKDIFRYDGHRMLRIVLPGKISCSALIQGSLYIAIQGHGLYELRDSRLLPVRGFRKVRDYRIVSLLPFRESVMIVTADHGLFLTSGDDIVPLTTEIDGFIKESQVFCAAYSDNRYAFGTILNGVVTKDFASGNVSYANITTGMQNNTVLSLSFDVNRNLWAGLDDGIDLIKLNSPYTNLLSSANRFGAGYMSLLDNGALYLGTNQGLFVTRYPCNGPSAPDLTPVIRGQVWDVSAIDGRIFVCADNGLYCGSGSQFSVIPGITGTWSVQRLKAHPGYALVSGYEGFFILSLDGTVTNRGRVHGYDDIGGHFTQDNEGYIWMPHWLKGLYRLSVNPETLMVTHCDFFNSRQGLATDHNNNVMMIGGRLTFSTEGGFMTFDGQRFNYDTALGRRLGVFTPAKLIEAPSGDLWCISDKHIVHSRNTAAGQTGIDSVRYSFIGPMLIPGFENFNFLPDNHLIVSGQEGFIDIDMQYDPGHSRPLKLIIDEISANGTTVVCRAGFGGDMPKLEIGPEISTLDFRFAMPMSNDDSRITYSCMLEGCDDDWSSYTGTSLKGYTNLGPGKYVMHVRAMHPLMPKEYETSFAFTILPPWYLSNWAKAVYMILVLALLECARRAVRIWMTRSTRRLAERQEKELEDTRRKAREDALQKDVEIATLKGRQLELDVKHKAEELSNLTMNIVRKNEILGDISNRLKKLQDGEISVEVNRQIEKLHGIIRDNISHDDDWKNFVHNFDAAYEDFTKRLTDLHPDLTITELRTCCYIKMGLSSKDIAPLFNISYRSVEMTRYRLRRKLNLERSENLSDYLLKI